MAGNTFEERLTRLEEQFKALQALTQGMAAWEMGAAGTPEIEKAPAPARADERDSVFVGVEGSAHHDEGTRREGGEPRASR
jgi:hypothetical protein